MEAEKKIELDGCTYIMRPANAIASWNALKAAGAVFKGMELEQPAKGQDLGKSKIDIGAILGNLGDPAIAKIERIVFDHTNVQVAGENPFRLADRLETHFNDRRGDLIPVLVAGIQYQYADFFTSAAPTLAKLFGKAKALTA